LKQDSYFNVLVGIIILAHFIILFIKFYLIHTTFYLIWVLIRVKIDEYYFPLQLLARHPLLFDVNLQQKILYAWFHA
jgi:hypothetical protein